MDNILVNSYQPPAVFLANSNEIQGNVSFFLEFILNSVYDLFLFFLISELFFLIAKFLKNSPCKGTFEVRFFKFFFNMINSIYITCCSLFLFQKLLEELDKYDASTIDYYYSFLNDRNVFALFSF